MGYMVLPVPQEQALRARPHLAFVIECLGLAAIGKISSRHELMSRLGRCLELLVTNYGSGKPAAVPNLALWLGKATEEYRSLPEQDLTPLLSACSGNTMPAWLKTKVRSELGETVSDLITACLECQ
jgi:hypothetical protein